MGFQIIKQLTIGDDETLEITIRDYYPKIYSYLYRRLLNEALAKDLTQETFYRFFAHINDYHDNGKLLNYLYRIAQRLLYDHTKVKRVNALEFDEEQTADHSYDGHQLFQQQEEIMIIRKWIKALPINLQDIIYLRFYEKMKFKDISAITGVHVSTLKSQAKLAITMLEQMAKQEGWK